MVSQVEVPLQKPHDLMVELHWYSKQTSNDETWTIVWFPDPMAILLKGIVTVNIGESGIPHPAWSDFWFQVQYSLILNMSDCSM